MMPPYDAMRCDAMIGIQTAKPKPPERGRGEEDIADMEVENMKDPKHRDMYKVGAIDGI